MLCADQDSYFAHTSTDNLISGDEVYSPNSFRADTYNHDIHLNTFTFDNILEAPSAQATSIGHILGAPPIRRLRFSENSPSIIGEDFPYNPSYSSYGVSEVNNLDIDMDHQAFHNHQHPNNLYSNNHERTMVLSCNQLSPYVFGSDEPSPISNSSADSDSLFVTSDEDNHALCPHHPGIYPNGQHADVTPSRSVTQAIFTDPNSTRVRTQTQSTPGPQNCSNFTSNRSGRGIVPSSTQTRYNLKRQSASRTSSQQPSGIHKPVKKPRKRLAPDEDPENHIIKSLRTVKRMTWGEIVTVLNNARIRRGEEPSFTEAAVYGRFKRNAPLIAHAEGDFQFDTDEYMYMRKRKDNGHAGDVQNTMNINTTTATPPRVNVVGGMQVSSADDRLLKRLYEEVSQDIWELVSEKFEAETGKELDALACAERFRNMSS